jgi:ABC-type polysaccharide/polyol phosphate transport system ATPase subunit
MSCASARPSSLPACRCRFSFASVIVSFIGFEEGAITAIDLVNVSLDFPIYAANGRSIRTDLMRRIGGRIEEGEESGRLVVRALRHINLSLRPGDRLGLIGPNGSGKSTLLRVMAGVYEPPVGIVRVIGKTSSLLDLTLGIDFELTGYENIILRGAVLGMTLAEARAKTPEIANFSELGQFCFYVWHSRFQPWVDRTLCSSMR